MPSSSSGRARFDNQVSHDAAPKTCEYATVDEPVCTQSSALAGKLQSGQSSTMGDISESSSLLAESTSLITPANIKDSFGVWKQEAGIIFRYSVPMILTLLLQYSLTASSILVVGHLGKQELGAVSLANMTAVITGYAIYQGLASSLDTLCPQAYGSGNFKLVGLQTQRLTVLLLLVTIPIVGLWSQSDRIFIAIIPHDNIEVAILAGRYLKIVLSGTPGYAVFEAGKRFMQAQGLFRASLYVLLICAPLNAIMSWVFVWRLNWGFIGAPISVAITSNLLPIILALYVRFIAGSECWVPITSDVFKNWQPMLRLAIPGLFTIEAEFLAWEVLTLLSAHLGASELAAQSALTTIVSIAYQVSLSGSIASSTRISNLVGAGLIKRAISATRVSICLALLIGTCNLSILVILRKRIPDLFTADTSVRIILVTILPLVAAIQIADAMAVACSGALRAVGRPEIGTYVQLIFCYTLALPISIALAFGAGKGILGLWTGMCVGLAVIAGVQLVFVYMINWEKAVKSASERNRLL